MLRTDTRAIQYAIALAFSVLSTSALANSYIFRSSEASRSMLQKTTTALFVSSVGRLWIGTQQGLHAYTGLEVSSYYYDPSERSGLQSDNISAITEIEDGTILIGTNDRGAYSFDPKSETFSRVNIRSDSAGRMKPVYALYVDSSDQVWIGLDEGYQVLKRSSGDDNFEVFETYTTETGAITGFAETSAGVWALSSRNGISLVDKTTFDRTQHLAHTSIFGTTASEATGIIADRNETLWIWSLRRGLVAVEPKSSRTLHTLFSSEQGTAIDISIYSVLESSPGVYLIGTSRGPYEYHADQHRLLPLGEEFFSGGSPTVTSLARGSNETVWFGTLYGPVSGTPRLFGAISSLTTALPSDAINVLEESLEGYWLGTENGLTLIDRDLEVAQSYNDLTSPRLSDPTVMAIEPEENGLWVGTFNGGLNRIDLKKGETTIYRSDENDPKSLGANGVTSLLRTKNNNLLIGTYGGGLNVFDPKTNSFNRYLPGKAPGTISSDKVLAVFQCSLGNIYVGTESGLNVFNEASGEFIQIYADLERDTALSSDFVWAFFEDSEGDLWIASYRGGITKWTRDERSTGSPTFQHAPPNISEQLNTIAAIAEDPAGYIWLSHNGGLTRISKDYEYVRSFGLNDGLLDTEFNVGAALSANDGTIFFAGNRGINSIDPDLLPGVDAVPDISIAEIVVMSERVIASTDEASGLPTINLDYNDRLLEVNFFSSYIASPREVEYGFLLQGINDDWVTGKERHSATFTTLPTGSYTLKTAAANPSGAWNWEGPKLVINVAPPPWLSPTAYTIYCLVAFLSVLYLFRRQREKDLQQAAAREELELMVKQRTNELEIASAKADEANRAKSQFLAAMSHEIRTPMHGMLGTLDLLQNTPLTPDQTRYAENAKRAGRSLLNIINDILDFSKLEASRVELEVRAFNVNHMVEEICLLQAATITDKNVMVVHTALKPINCMIEGDEKKLGQCITNLVSNAIKFTENGRVIVRPEIIHSPDTEKSILKVFVSDDGIGMDKETQRRVFQEFTQADTSTTRKYGGTGLGLSITKQFIELMHGNIELVSAPSQGTTAKLTIPVRSLSTLKQNNQQKIQVYVFGDDMELTESIASNCEQLGYEPLRRSTIHRETEANHESFSLVPVDSRIEHALRGSGHRILTYATNPNSPEGTDLRFPIDAAKLQELIEGQRLESSLSNQRTTPGRAALKALLADDVPLNRRIAHENLISIGIEATVVSNGVEAVDEFTDQEFDIVFMDCQMPVLDGYAATRKMRAFESANEKPRTPIIALTAGKGSDQEIDSIKAGMDAMLLKPFTVDQLQDAIENHVKEKQSPSPKIPANGGREAAADTAPSLINNPAMDNPTIDNEVLKNFQEIAPKNSEHFIIKLGEGFQQQMVEKFCTVFDERVERTEEQLRVDLHTMKSMSMNMGAIKLTNLFANLESGVKHGTASLAIEQRVLAESLLAEYLETLIERAKNDRRDV